MLLSQETLVVCTFISLIVLSGIVFLVGYLTTKHVCLGKVANPCDDIPKWNTASVHIATWIACLVTFYRDFSDFLYESALDCMIMPEMGYCFLITTFLMTHSIFWLYGKLFRRMNSYGRELAIKRF